MQNDFFVSEDGCALALRQNVFIDGSRGTAKAAEAIVENVKAKIQMLYFIHSSTQEMKFSVLFPLLSACVCPCPHTVSKSTDDTPS